MNGIQKILLVLIVIGIGLLVTESLWVPMLVDSIVRAENPSAPIVY